MTNKLTRRTLLKGSLAGAGAAVALPASSWAKAPGANNDVRVAIVGVGGKGRQHAGVFHRLKGVRVVALCEVDAGRLGGAMKGFKGSGKPKAVVDFRKILDDKSIDAIATATPNHWHALVTIWGCQAGKHVYVEKPVCHNIWEGRRMIEVARKCNKVVQTGTQLRSDRGSTSRVGLPNAPHRIQSLHLPCQGPVVAGP